MSIFGHAREKSKPIITIWAEEAGSFTKDEYEYAFGNGSHEQTSGYPLLADGRVLRMAYTCFRLTGKAGVAVAVDDVETNYSIYLDTELSNYITFPEPLDIKAGSVINFISKVRNFEAKNSVVSLLIELHS